MTKAEHEKRWPDREFGKTPIYAERKWLYADEDRHKYPNYQVEDNGWQINLSHSCDEWVIGSVEQAEQFAKDLAEAIAYCKSNP